MLGLELTQIVFLVIILAVSIWLHEFAHAISSYKLWDPTPKLQNRLTPNPINHIDPLGFIAIFFIHFWWWKPVEVNPSYYKKPVRDELIVSLAWPFTNFLLAIFGILFLLFYVKFTNWNIAQWDLLSSFRQLFTFINFALAIFNLIPLPPLDGFRLVKFFKPLWAQEIVKYQLHIAVIFIALIIIAPGVIGGTIMSIVKFLFDLFRWILSSIIL